MSFFSYPVHSNEYITVSTIHYPPIIYEKEVSEMGYGIGRDIVTSALQAADYQPRYSVVPMPESIWSVFSDWNTVNLGVTRWFKNQNQAHKIDSVKIFDMRFVFFYKKQRFPEGVKFNKLSELSPYIIGNVRGSLTTDLLAKAKLKVRHVKQVDQNIRLLIDDHIDLAVAVDLTGWEIINELQPGKAHEFATVENPIITEPLALIFRSEEQELKKRFSAGLNQIMADGRFTDIIHRYYSHTDIEIPQDILSRISESEN